MRNRSLDALLPKTRQGILAAMLVQPAKAWYVSELARRMGVPSSSLQRELQDLTEAGILKTQRQGRMANSLLLEDGFALPFVVVKDHNRRVWNPGFLSNVLLGAIAALATYLLGSMRHGRISSGAKVLPF